MTLKKVLSTMVLVFVFLAASGFLYYTSTHPYVPPAPPATPYDIPLYQDLNLANTYGLMSLLKTMVLAFAIGWSVYYIGKIWEKTTQNA